MTNMIHVDREPAPVTRTIPLMETSTPRRALLGKGKEKSEALVATPTWQDTDNWRDVDSGKDAEIRRLNDLLGRQNEVIMDQNAVIDELRAGSCDGTCSIYEGNKISDLKDTLLQISAQLRENNALIQSMKDEIEEQKIAIEGLRDSTAYSPSRPSMKSKAEGSKRRYTAGTGDWLERFLQDIEDFDYV
ncbi:hypothetical protein AX16_002873 [Volvariella volvacea WC 439]|nr:hypothetical protein AX16_002873 [Volvariella volvacea WC 439]